MLDTLYELAHLRDEFCRVIAQTPLKSRHLKIVCPQHLVAKVLPQGVAEPAFATTWDASDKNDRD